MPVGLEQSKQIMQEELRSIQINVFLVGMCMVNCPFGAIADKSQILPVDQGNE